MHSLQTALYHPAAFFQNDFRQKNGYMHNTRRFSHYFQQTAPPFLPINRLFALVLHNKTGNKRQKTACLKPQSRQKASCFYGYSFLSKSKTTLFESSLSLALNGLPDLDIKSSSSVVSPCKMRFAEVKVMRAPKTLAPNLNLQPLL